MRLKSYHSATVEAAIRLAHIELGDEAVFLGSRRNGVGSDPNQAYEVTFAVIGIEDTERDTASAGRSPAPAGVARAAGARPGATVPHTTPHTDTTPHTTPRFPDKPARAAVARPAANGAAAAAAAGGVRSGANSPGTRRPGNGSGGNSTGNNNTAGNGTAGNGPIRNAAAANSTASSTAANRAVVGDAARAGGSGIVSWKKFLRHVNHRDAAGPLSADSEAAEASAQQDEESSAAGQNGGAARDDGPPRNGGPVRNGGARNGAAMPHWREFVPGSERRAEAPQDVFLADASRVVQAGDPRPAPKQPPAAASRNGGAAIRPVSAPRVPPPPERTSEVYSLQKLGAELEELRRMFERQQAGRTPLVLPSRELLSDTRLAAFYRRLTDNSVEPTLASELLASLQQAAAAGADGRRLGALLAEEVRKRFTTQSELGRPGASIAIAALAGPSGAGKTTAVAKLAFRCGLLRRRRVRLLSVDPLRMGAVESLQAYAELMNLPFEIVDDLDRLGATLRAAGEGGGQELLLMDTPGYGRREWGRAQRLAAVLNACGAVEVHLVLDLRTKSDDLRRTVEHFRLFRPAKLLFTRLDETTTFGTMLNETVRTGLPVSFVSVGQRVPEDIVPAGEPELLRLLLKDRASN